MATADTTADTAHPRDERGAADRAGPDGAPAHDASSLSRNWWTFVLRGALALLFAVLAFVAPGGALYAATIAFGAFAFADGVLELVAAVRRMRRGERWGWLLFGGVMAILTALVVLIAPLLATFVLATFLAASIAFWSVATGIGQIVAAVRLRREIKGEVWLGLSGLISVLLGLAIGFVLFTAPLQSALATGWLLGVFAATYGVFLIMLGLRLRRSQRETA